MLREAPHPSFITVSLSRRGRGFYLSLVTSKSWRRPSVGRNPELALGPAWARYFELIELALKSAVTRRAKAPVCRATSTHWGRVDVLPPSAINAARRWRQ